MVSKRLQEVPASGTIAISNLVSQMKAEGVDIVSFSMGEPDFTTPENIIDACCDSLHAGFTHYTPSTGIPELREAVAEMENRVDGVPCKASNVLITPTKQAIFMIALAYIDPGDEVILMDPSGRGSPRLRLREVRGRVRRGPRDDRGRRDPED